MKKNFLLALLLINVLVFTSLSCSKSSDTPSTGGGGGSGGVAPTQVNILSMSYTPANLSVKVGTVVRWSNTDANPHTVTSNDNSTFSSGTINYGASYSYTTVATGTFPYHCTIHGMTMAATLTVTP